MKATRPESDNEIMTLQLSFSFLRNPAVGLAVPMMLALGGCDALSQGEETDAPSFAEPLPSSSSLQAHQGDAQVVDISVGSYYSILTRNPQTGVLSRSVAYVPPGVQVPAGASPVTPAPPVRTSPPPAARPTQAAGGGSDARRFGTVVSRRVVGQTRQVLPTQQQQQQPSTPSAQTGNASNAGGGSLARPSGPAPDDSPTSFGPANLRYPNFLAPGQTFTTGPAAIRDSGNLMCALTFDDGPHGDLDPKVLDILKEKGVKATFFYLGRLINAYPEIVLRAQAEGHEIGQHSYDHKDMSTLSAGAIATQFDRTSLALDKIGIKAKVFRPPYGAYNNRVLGEALTRGMETVNWTNDSLDWKLREPASVINQVMKNAEPGDVILLHSIQRATVAALPTIIERLKRKGCQFTTVSTWLDNVT